MRILVWTEVEGDGRRPVHAAAGNRKQHRALGRGRRVEPVIARRLEQGAAGGMRIAEVGTMPNVTGWEIRCGTSTGRWVVERNRLGRR